MGIPPDFCNSVVGAGSPTALLCHLVEGGLQKMALDIFPGIKGFREAFHEGAVILFPVAEEFLLGHPGFTVNAVNEFNHFSWGGGNLSRGER